MNQHEYKTFIDAWANVHEVMPGGKQISTGAMRIVVESLKKYPLEALLDALERHLKTSRYAPAPKDIIDLLEAKNAHISADEAWAIVIESLDENATVVLTQEMAEARGIALPIIEAGDMIGARMAFKEAYARIILSADKPQWFVSEGWDSARRIDAVKKAVQLGRLPAASAKAYLPVPVDFPVGGLLRGTVTELPNNDKRLQEKWGELKTALDNGKSKMDEADQKRREEAAMKKRAEELRREELIAQAVGDTTCKQ